MANTFRFGVDDSALRRAEFKEVLKEEKAEYRGYHPVCRANIHEPEFSSIQSFVKYMNDEADDFGVKPPYTAEHLEKLSIHLKKSLEDVARELRGAGLVPAKRDPMQRPRGYRSTENLWAQNPSFATSAQTEITGFASGKGSGRSPQLGMKKRVLTENELKRIKKDYFKSKPEKLGAVNPEKDRERLRLIKEGTAIRSDLDQLKRDDQLKNEQAIALIKHRERLQLSLLIESEALEKITDTKRKLDRCIRFFRIVSLFKDRFGVQNMLAIEDEIVKVKAVYFKLIG